MRTTIDLSDELYSHLRTLAAERGTSIKALIHDAVRSMLTAKRASAKGDADFPMIRSKRPGSVKLTSEMIHDVEMSGS